MNNNQTPNFGQSGPTVNADNVRPIKQKKKIPVIQITFVLIILFAMVFGSSFIYVVDQDEVAVVKVFNETKKVIVDVNNEVAKAINAENPNFKNVEVINKKGLFFKIPFITQVDMHTSKLITYVSNEGKVTTSDKVPYIVNFYAQWEIIHPGLYETNYGTVTKANSRIDETLYANIINLINDLDSETFLTDKATLYEALNESLVNYNNQFMRTGIKVTDLEIYRVQVPESTYESVYNKMNQDRYKESGGIRADGLKLYNEAVYDTDLEVTQIKAAAIREAAEIRGKADADAIQIYANAFSKDPEFYEFWRMLTAYEQSIDENTVLYMDKNNPFIKYITQGIADIDFDTFGISEEEYNALMSEEPVVEESQTSTEESNEDSSDEDTTTDSTETETTEE